jgi:hypothetical protein
MLLGHTFRAFRHRDFRIFWFGLFLGHTGALFQSTAQAWLIFELTDSAFYLGLDGLCLGLPRIIFSAFGGALIPLIGAGGCFFLNAFGLPKWAPGASPKKSILRETIDVIVLAWNTPVFRSLFITLTIISLFTKSYTQLMPLFARDILGVGAPGLGLLLMAPGAGAIVGGLAMAALRKSYQVRSLLMFLLTSFGFGLMLFSASEIFYASLFLLFLTGAFHTALLSLIASLLQMHSAVNVRGRIMGLFGLLNRGLGPMGAFPLGALAAGIGAPLALSIAIRPAASLSPDRCDTAVLRGTRSSTRNSEIRLMLPRPRASVLRETPGPAGRLRWFASSSPMSRTVAKGE